MTDLDSCPSSGSEAMAHEIYLFMWFVDSLSLVCRRMTLTSPGNRSWSNLFALTMVTLQMCSTSLGPRYGITTGGVI